MFSLVAHGIFAKNNYGQAWWLMPVISATWEAEIGRIAIQDQPGQIVLETPSAK
jgi:hypothetical protein